MIHTFKQIFLMLALILSAVTVFEAQSGREATGELKGRGRYQTLVDAVRETRRDKEISGIVASDTVDPTSEVTAPDAGPGDFFGSSVSISGDTAVVGAFSHNVSANTDQGAAYVFVRSGGTWTLQAKLTAADGAAGDNFGISVGIAGETIIVGAWTADVGFNTDQGAAYIFVRSGGVWTQQSKLTAIDGAENDYFGFAVAISGETAMIGAPLDNIGSRGDQGSGYIFTQSGAVWSQQAKLTADDGAATDEFGFAVAIDGETAIFSAVGDSIGANLTQGSAYVFMRSGGVWAQQAKLVAADGTANESYGERVGISGESIIVGSNFHRGSQPGGGAAYIYVRNGMSWTQQGELTAADGAFNDSFGMSVGISGGTAVVGATLADIGSNQDQGAAYIFVRTGIVWTQQQKLIAPDGAANDNFGYGAAISGAQILIGSPTSGTAARALAPQAVQQGSAYFYVYQPPGPTAAVISISGRVMTGSGAGLRNAIVYLTDRNGATSAAQTTIFGNYRFEGLPAGGAYILSVSSKQYSFAPQLVSANDNLTSIDFHAQP